MSLRLKTFSILFVFLVSITAVLYWSLYHYMFKTFEVIEHVHLKRIAHQVAHIIESEERFYDSFVRDWAIWNDSFEFIETRRQKFIDDNLDPDGIKAINTLAIVYFDLDFNVVYQFSAPEDQEDLQRIIGKIQHKKSSIFTLNLEDDPSFILCIEEIKRPMLAAIHPIFPTNHSPPHNGYLLMGRLIDQDFSAAISRQTGYDFTLVKGDREERPSHIQVTTKLINKSMAQMELAVQDLNNRCSFKLSAETPREMYQYSEKIFNVTMTIAFIVGLLGIVLVEYILHQFVLGPISHQIRQFKTIAIHSDCPQTIEEEGSGEVLLLAQTANRMLNKIYSLNRQLQLASEKDSLTGLWNRRRFDRQLQHEWKFALRHNEPLSLLMLDVDYFKRFNDRYGHQQGDQCLQKVAQAIMRCANRETDLSARYGGEEFTVILPAIDRRGAETVAECIRTHIEQLQITHEDSEVHAVVTISCGIATLNANHGGTPENLIRLADQALYRAKGKGRNCCVFGSITED